MTCRIHASSDLDGLREASKLYVSLVDWSSPSEHSTCQWLMQSIPSELGRLQALEELSLSERSLRGSIPSEVGQLLRLRQLLLTRNMLSNTIPTELGKLRRIHRIAFTMNCFSGSIPTELGLRPLGECPSNFYITTIDLEGNRLIGAIPTEFGLRDFCSSEILFRNNSLSRSIPTELGKLVSARTLGLDKNSLSSSIPSELGRMHRLANLDLSSNSLSGTIITLLGSMQEFEALRLSSNLLEGRIPSEIGKLHLGSKFLVFEVNSNSMKGSPPSELFKLRSVVYQSRVFFKSIQMRLEENSFRGKIPSEMGKMGPLGTSIIAMNRNQFSGSLPSELGQLRGGAISLSRNRLQGTLPSELARFWSRTMCVLLAWNELAGTLPDSIFQGRDRVVVLHRNHFTGSLPRIDASLNVMTLHSNQFGGSVPSFAFSTVDMDARSQSDDYAFTLHGNHFSCELPERIFLVNFRGGERISHNLAFNHSSSLIGNSFRGPLPRWIPQNENDPLLYREPNTIYEVILFASISLLVLCFSAWSISGVTKSRPALSLLLTEISYVRCVLCTMLIIVFLSLFVFWPAFIIGARWYECPDFPQNLSQLNHSWAEYFVAGCMVVDHFLFLKCIRQSGVEISNSHMGGDYRRVASSMSPLCLCIACLGWALVVIGLSLPSAVFTLVRSLPKENTLVRFVGENSIMISYRLSTFLDSMMVMFILPDVSKSYGDWCGINNIQLEMWSRVFSVWIIPVGVVVVNENCFGKWRSMWSVCSFERGKGRFDIPFFADGYEDLLTTSDLCESPSLFRVASNSSCSRVVVDVMSRLLIQKSLIDICIVPCIRSWRWNATAAQSNFKFGSMSRRVLRWLSFTEAAAALFEISLVSKSLELSIIWGTLIPVVPPFLLLACVLNLLINRIGMSFAAFPPLQHPKYISSVYQATLCRLSRFGFLFAFCLYIFISWQGASLLCIVPVWYISKSIRQVYFKDRMERSHASETEMAIIES